MSLKKRFEKGIIQAVEILEQGGSVVYPTDTCYGLGVNAENLNMVKKVYLIKQRPTSQPMHILVSDIEMAKRYVLFSRYAKEFLKKFSSELFPIALTLLLPLKKKVPRGVRFLSAKSGFLGVRISNDKISKKIIEKFGKPMTTPSANPKGGKPPYSIDESRIQFEGMRYQPDFYVDGGTLKRVPPSTMIQIEGNQIKILRGKL